MFQKTLQKMRLNLIKKLGAIPGEGHSFYVAHGFVGIWVEGLEMLLKRDTENKDWQDVVITAKLEGEYLCLRSVYTRTSDPFGTVFKAAGGGYERLKLFKHQNDN